MTSPLTLDVLLENARRHQRQPKPRTLKLLESRALLEAQSRARSRILNGDWNSLEVRESLGDAQKLKNARMNSKPTTTAWITVTSCVVNPKNQLLPEATPLVHDLLREA